MSINYPKNLIKSLNEWCMDFSNTTEDNIQFVRKMIKNASKLVLNDNPVDTIKEITDYMIEKEKQDRLWNELSEEKKEKYSKEYKEAIDDCGESALIERRELLAEIFGSHNLNPKPQTPKTWEDVEKECPNIKSETDTLNYHISTCIAFDDEIDKKLIATYKIAKLIELGYGGMVSEEEALDDNIEKSAIDLYEGKIQLHTGICIARGDRFLMFRSNKMGEEFMSHESNRQLVKQYFMI